MCLSAIWQYGCYLEMDEQQVLVVHSAGWRFCSAACASMQVQNSCSIGKRAVAPSGNVGAGVMHSTRLSSDRRIVAVLCMQVVPPLVTSASGCHISTPAATTPAQRYQRQQSLTGSQHMQQQQVASALSVWTCPITWVCMTLIRTAWTASCRSYRRSHVCSWLGRLRVQMPTSLWVRKTSMLDMLVNWAV